MSRERSRMQLLFGADTDTLRGMLARHKQEGKKIALLTDQNVMDKLWHLVRDLLPELEPTKVFVLKQGESEKSLDTASDIWSALLRDDFQARDVLLSLGGGVVTDLGGFVAANFKRGINCWHLPTSLVGMIDAAIGAKNAVNYQGFKNQIGTFYNPGCIYIQRRFLETLPGEELKNGYAEWIKHLLIAAPESWEKWQRNGDPTAIPAESALRDNLQIKLDLVSRDPFDLNERRALNFGHSLGHAMEGLAASLQSPLPHGQAVAYGMMLESWISTVACGLERSDFLNIQRNLESIYGAVPAVLKSLHGLQAFLKKDKKNQKETAAALSLLSAPGQPEVNCSVSYSKLEEILAAYPN